MKQMFRKYSLLIYFLFLCFLAGVLSLGRAFSIIHIKTPFLPLFVTELMLLISLPLIAVHARHILKLPKTFLCALCAYFLFGCFYLLMGMANRNLFALRDIVLCIYILFLPLTFIVFAQRDKLRLFLFVLILANAFGLLVGRLYLFNIPITAALKNFIVRTKPFNLGLYFGIASSFLIPFFSTVKNRKHRILVAVLLSLNLYMTIIFGVRTVWVAAFCLIIFYLLLLRKKAVTVFLSIAPVFIITSCLFYYLDFKLLGFNQRRFFSKAESVKIIAKYFLRSPVSKEPRSSCSPDSFVGYLTANKRKGRVGNIVWRLNIWKQSIKFGLQQPLVGRGFGVYPEYRIRKHAARSPDRIDVNSGITPTHNHLVSIFYKMGILGLGLFLFVNIYVFLYGIIHINRCASEFARCFLIGSLGAFVFWHAMAFFFDVIDSPPTSIFLWIIIGFIFGSVEVDKKYDRDLSKSRE